MRSRRRRYNSNRDLEFDNYVSPIEPRHQQQTESPYPRTPYQRRDSAGDASVRSAHRPELPQRTKGDMFGDLVSIPINTTIDPLLGACFKYWQDGHTRKVCPRPKVARYCLNCGRRGMDLYSRLRCGPAYARYVAKKFGQPVGSPGVVANRQESSPTRKEALRRTQSAVSVSAARATVPQPGTLATQTPPLINAEPEMTAGAVAAQGLP